MRFIISCLLWCLLIPFTSFSQKVDKHLTYLKQKPPTLNPEINKSNLSV